MSNSELAQLLLLSAKDEQALTERATSVAGYIDEEQPSLVDVASSLERGRAALPHRGALLVPAGTDPAKALRELDASNFVTGIAKAGLPRLAWLFPGQGAQFRGMAKGLYEEQPVFRENFDACAAVLDERLGQPLHTLVFSDSPPSSESGDPLNQTEFTQPALFAIEVCLARTLEHFGVKPDVLIGHSLGELAAACFAGVFELEAGLVLAHERGRLMQSMPSGSMLAIKASLEEVQSLIGEGIDLAAINAPTMIVISGPHDAVDHFEARASEKYTCRRLHTSHAFHSKMMDPVVDAFVDLVTTASPAPPRVPIISTLTGRLLSDEEAVSVSYWARQLRHAVHYSDAARSLLEPSREQPSREQPRETVLLEVGPGTTLLSAAAQQREVPRPRASIETLGHPKQARDASEAFLLSLGRLWTAGVPVAWNRVYHGASKQLLRLPVYTFTKKRYWVEPPEGESESSTLLLPGQDVSENVDASIEDKVVALISARMGEKLAEEDRRRTFVELGFDSLALTQLGGRIRERFGVRVGHRVLLESANTPVRLAEYLAANGANTGDVASVRPAAIPASGPYDLTPGQREIWVQSRTSAEASKSYVQCRRITLRGVIDEVMMQDAFKYVTARHSALRTIFAADGSTQEPEGPSPPFEFIDLTREAEPEQSRLLRAIAKKEGGYLFDLRRGPLMHAKLVKLGEAQFELWLNAHHIVYDGRTSALVVSELARTYSALAENRQPELEPASSFRWYVARLEEEDRGPALEFWKTQFSSLPDLLELPVDRPRGPQRAFEGNTRYLQGKTGLFPKVIALAEQEQTSLFTVLLAAYQALLSRLTGQDDVTVGVPFQSPGVEEARALAGHTVNLLPVRTTVASTKSFKSLLRQVHEVVLSARDHSSVTFSEILSALSVPREAGRLPLLETMFNVSRKLDQLRFGEAVGVLEYVDKQAIQYDFFINVVPRGEDLLLVCDYVGAMYDAETIDRWLDYYLRLVEQVCGDADIELGALKLLSTREQKDILSHRPADTAFDREGNTALAFLKVAERTPDATALVVGKEHWSYARLSTRAKQYAFLLRKRGVRPGSRVAICLPRTGELVASLFGTWLAGGAYIPVDPYFPPDRINMILEDAKPTVVVTTQQLLSGLQTNAEPLCIDTNGQELDVASTELPSEPAKGDDLAYIIFTSGSTGRPKGVQIPHRCLTNFLDSMRIEPGLGPSDRLLAVTTISFDIAALELFLPLTTGACVDLAPYEMALDPKALAKRLKSSQATVLQATPATWRMMVDSGWQGAPGLRMFCGGEALPRPLADALLARGSELWNLYGPTETTIWSTLCRVQPGTEIDIGKPIANTAIYVVDDRGRLQLPGVAGELWIGGEGVGLGYWDNPALTEEKFVPDPFADKVGARAYRTGDLVRMRPDGRLEFIGRIDHQVKVRGFRIELGEIETVLLGCSGVQQAVVIARPDAQGQNELIAYIIAEGAAPSVGALRAVLEEALPGYMVPAHFVTLEAYPLTPNGKVDRKALPAPVPQASSEASAESSKVIERTPRSPAEEIIQQIWQEVLGVGRPGIHQNFYALGGNSMGAVRIVDAANAAGLDVSPLQFFQTPTIAGLAEASSTRTPPGGDASLVVLREAADGDTSAPLFLVHSAPGDVVGYAQLLREFPQGRAVYGFQSLGLKDPALIHHSIEAMAAHYVQVMRNVFPNGPYHIGGWCFGGNVAMEMARIVQDEHHKMGALLLLEAFPRVPQGTLHATRRLALTAKMGMAGARLLRDMAVARLRNRTVMEKEAEEVYGLSLDSGPFKYRREVYDANVRAIRAYRTTRFDGSAVILKSTHSRGGVRDPDYGWRRLIASTEIHEFEADHNSMLEPPVVSQLAQTILRVLAHFNRST